MKCNRLTEQKQYEFHYVTKVRSRDINYRGHLGNDALVSLLGEAGLHMFYSLGFKHGDIGNKKIGVVMADLKVSYLAESFMFDAIEIDTHVGHPEKNSFMVFHRVRRDNSTVALAEVNLISFDYDRHKVVRIPGAFLRSLTEHVKRVRTD